MNWNIWNEIFIYVQVKYHRSFQTKSEKKYKTRGDIYVLKSYLNEKDNFLEIDCYSNRFMVSSILEKFWQVLDQLELFNINEFSKIFSVNLTLFINCKMLINVTYQRKYVEIDLINNQQ